jgi:hypothetical protein
MARVKKHMPEQIVSLLRQNELADPFARRTDRWRFSGLDLRRADWFIIAAL